MSDEKDAGKDAIGLRVGERLRIAREQQHLSLEDIAARTRVPTRHLKAIEEGEYQSLPVPTYSAGFVKSYARLLGLDAHSLSAEFRTEMGVGSVPHPQQASYEPADPRRTPPPGLALLAVLVAVLVGLGYLYWRGSIDQPAELAARGPEIRPGASAPARPGTALPGAATPAVAAPGGAIQGEASPGAAMPGTAGAVGAPGAAAAAGGPVVIGASKDVWIKVSDRGKTLFMGILKTGDHFALPADAAEPMLTTGRPGSTTILVGATAIRPVGDPDRIAKNVSLKAPDLLAHGAAASGTAQPPAPVASEGRAGLD